MSESGDVGVLMVASSAGFGGGERNLLDLTRALTARGVRVEVAVPAPGRLSALLDAEEIRWHAVPMGGSGIFGGALALRRLYRRVQPAIVHAHGLRASLPARLARIGTTLRLVYSLHGLHYLHYPSAGKRWAFLAGERSLRSLADRFVCVSAADREAAVAAGAVIAARTAVVHNGVPPAPARDREASRAAFGLAAEDVAVVSLMRLEPEKGPDVLVSAVARLAERGIRPRVLIAGDGSLRQATGAAIAAAGLGETVTLLGFTEDPDALLAAADVFVLASRWEGLPYSVLEAMAHGLPVVAPATGGMAEAVDPRVSGALVPPGDAAALADALSPLVEDAALRERQGAAGLRRWREGFTLEEMTSRFAALYADLGVAASAR